MTAQPALIADRPAKAPGVTTAAVLKALIAHYRKPGEARSGEILVTEAESPTGQRRCDLIRVGMWASRGTGIDGHEIKVSRADWLRELDQPAKAEAWWPYCTRWWVVAPPGVVAGGELPDGWGLMELPGGSGRRFKVRVQAAAKEPKLTIRLLVELLRRADNERLAEMDRMRGRHREELHSHRQQVMADRAEATLPYETKRRLELLEKIEEALGVPLDAWKGWGVPVTSIGAGELAAFLKDAAAHVAVQRRAEDTDRWRQELLREARRTVAALERKP